MFNKSNKTVRQFVILASLMLMLAVSVTPAFAAGPTDPNCWGQVSSQRASTFHDTGEHSSAQSSPRLGLGNVARALYDAGLTSGPHVSDLGAFLASVDGLDETFCP